MPHLRPADVTFFELRNTVFCVQCELMSYNSGSNCLACGSTALLTLARVLGGSLRNQERARLIEDDLIDRAVENILCSDMAREYPAEPVGASSISFCERDCVQNLAKFTAAASAGNALGSRACMHDHERRRCCTRTFSPRQACLPSSSWNSCSLTWESNSSWATESQASARVLA